MYYGNDTVSQNTYFMYPIHFLPFPFSIIQPVMFTLNYPPLDFVICQCWHGQALYWAMIFVSVYNLVLIAFERFLAICKPLHHERFNERRFRNIVSGFYFYSFTIGQAGSYFQVKFHFLWSYCVFEYLKVNEVFVAYLLL